MAVGSVAITSWFGKFRGLGDWAVTVEKTTLTEHSEENKETLELLKKLDTFRLPGESERKTNIERFLEKKGRPFLRASLFALPVPLISTALFFYKFHEEVTRHVAFFSVIFCALCYSIYFLLDFLSPFFAVFNLRHFDSEIRAIENCRFLSQVAQLCSFTKRAVKQAKFLVDATIERKKNWIRQCVGGSGRIALLIILLGLDRFLSSEQKIEEILSNTTQMFVSAAVIGIVIGSFAGNTTISRLVYQKQLLAFVLKQRKAKPKDRPAV